MKLLHIIPLAFMALTASHTTAQTLVGGYRTGVTPTGITYFLPTTQVRVVVTAHRTLYQPGIYARYAERYFNVTDAPQMPYEAWTITDIALEPYGTPDYSQAFTIALNPKTSAPLVTMTPDGILLAINEECEMPDEVTEASVRTLFTESYAVNEFLTPEIIRAGSESKKAELTAQEIYDIRENRGLIAKGQADFNPTDGTQLKLMLETLDKTEKALYSFFVGTKSEEEHTFVLDYKPTVAINDLPLFRFSRHLGFVDNDDLSGEPYYLTVINETNLPNYAEDPKVQKKLNALQDVRYRVPGRAHIYISNDEKKVIEVMLPVAQFGNIEHLGGNLFDKKTTTHVRLNPITGNIQTITQDEVKK